VSNRGHFKPYHARWRGWLQETGGGDGRTGLHGAKPTPQLPNITVVTPIHRRVCH
jgi:hypothetical protein